MKYIVLAIISLLALKSCSQEADQQKENIIFTYDEFSRGFANSYVITKEDITVKSGTIDDLIKSRPITAEEYQNLIDLTEAIDIKTLNAYESDSDERNRDAAAHAELNVKWNDEVYNSKTFDKGNAPKPLVPLVNAIIRLAETVE